MEKTGIKNFSAEDKFFSNLLTIITVGVALLLFLMLLVWTINANLNGINSPQTLRMTYGIQQLAGIYLVLILGLLSTASIIRWIASRDKIKRMSPQRFLQIFSFILLLVSAVILIFLIGIYADWWI